MNTIENTFGIQLLDFMRLEETRINEYQPLAGSFTVVQCEGRYLVCFNRKRNQWEIPAGKREAGETPRECAIRELYEETGQLVTDLSFIGLTKMYLKHKDVIHYYPVYYTSINELQPFVENDETNEIKLWVPNEEIGPIDPIDVKLLYLLYKGEV